MGKCLFRGYLRFLDFNPQLGIFHSLEGRYRFRV